jgi:class 3 adenylate cyclase/predicted ATPase
VASTPTRREERKVVTALFADVVGSTALAERLDPEDFRELVDEALDRMIASIERFGGSIERVMGDGVLALFGAPAAHEDDPERAVLAGLRIVELTLAYAQEISRSRAIEGFNVRVGIETGIAVLGRIGRGEQAEWGATGDALNTAARLEASAAPGAVLVGGATHRLVEPLFEWDEGRDLELKGKSEPVRAYEVRGHRSSTGRRGGRPGLATSVIGRERELALIREAVEEIGAGRGGVLLVLGEAGIGKTRMLVEARALLYERSAAGRAPLWLHGRCMSYAESFPYWPYQDMFKEWRGGEGNAPSVPVDRLNDLLGADADEVQPFLAPVLGLPIEGAGADRLAGLSPEALQHGTVAAVRLLLGRLADAGPLILALDDLHWADASSLALTEQLLSMTDEAPVLIVLAARPERDHAAWQIKEVATRELPHRTLEISLGGLADAADRLLVEELVGAGTLPADLEQRLLDRGEGNPFYIEELVRSMIDAGALVRDAAGLRFVPDVPVELSESVEKVVLARIDRLEPEPRRILDAACVLGRHFSLPLLEEVLAPDPLSQAAVRDLQRLDLLHEGARWPQQEYRFKHSLIQEAAYRSLLRRSRQELHRRVAEALENMPDEFEGRHGLLAHHWEAADEFAKALEYHRRAGDAARRIYATDEMTRHYDAALAAAASLGIDDSDPAVYRLHLERASGPWGYGARAVQDLEIARAGARLNGDRASEMEALIGLAVARRMADFNEALELLTAALEIAEELGDESSQVSVLGRLSIMDSNRLRFDSALELANRSLLLARRAGDDDSLARGMDALKLATLQIGDLEALERTTAELAAIHRRRGDDWYLIYVLLESSFVPIADGRFDEALARTGEALAIVDRIGDRISRPLVLDAISWVHRCRGDYGRALESARESASAGAAMEMPEWQAWSAATLGWTLLELHAPEAAMGALEAGISAAEAVGAPNQRIRCLSQLAWTTILTGDDVRSRRLTEEALRSLEQVSVPAGRAWLFGAHAYIALASALLALGHPERARALMEPVLEAAEAAGWLEFVSRGLLAIARCDNATGDVGRAQSKLIRALDVASGCAMPGPAHEAHSELARLHAGRGDERAAREHHAEADALARQLAATLSEDRLASAFLERALADPIARP